MMPSPATVNRRTLLAILGGSIATPLLAPRIAFAQEVWPARAVRYVNAFPAGGATDTLSPGAVETERLVKRFGDMETARRVSGPKHLLGRLGQPDEIAAAAVFLASDASRFMTGADLLVDGGYNAI